MPVLGTVLLLMGVSAIAATALGPDDSGPVSVEVLGAVETATSSPEDAATSSPEDAATSSPEDAATSSPGDAATSSPGDAATSSPEAASPSPEDAAPPAPVAAATPPTVDPVVPVPPPAVVDLPPAAELVGAAALALLPVDPAVRIPDWELVFLPGRDGVRALTFPRDRRIEVYVRESDTPEALVRVLAHELGHAVDVEDNDAADRARWRAARGAGPEVPWWPDGTTYDFDTLAGDFAEAYATWLVGSESVSRVGGPFTPEQLALVAELVG